MTSIVLSMLALFAAMKGPLSWDLVQASEDGLSLLGFTRWAHLHGMYQVRDHRIVEESQILDGTSALNALKAIPVKQFCLTDEWKLYSGLKVQENDCPTEFSVFNDVSMGPRSVYPRLGLDIIKLSQELPGLLGSINDVPPSGKGFSVDMSELKIVELTSLILVQWAAIQELESRVSLLEESP